VDRAVKISLDQTKLGSVATAQAFASFFQKEDVSNDTLIMPGTQAVDDIEGETGALLAELLGLPFIGVVSGITFAMAALKQSS
jgi:electron transfer flavoprotein alpha/beta subunit